MNNKSDVFPQQKPVNVLTKFWSLDLTKIYNRFRVNVLINPFKDEAQTALFKDPVRTAQ